MAKAIANVVISTDTFSDWLIRTNQIADTITRYAVTVDSNTVGATVTGNGSVVGIFSANTIAVGTFLRGGSVNASANLNVSSNANFFGSILYSSANVIVENANVSVNSSAVYIKGGLLSVTSNVNVSTSNVSVNANILSVSGNNVLVTSNTLINAFSVEINSANAVIKGTELNIFSNVDIVASTLKANAVVSIIGNTTITANNIALKPNSSILAFSILNNNLVTNTTITGNTLTIFGNTFFSNTINVERDATVNGFFLVNNSAAFGNSTVTGFINVSSDGTFGGTVNTIALNVGPNVNLTTSKISVGNSTINTVLTSSSIVTDGTLSVYGVSTLSTVTSGNNFLTGFINVTSYGNFGGAVNASSLNLGSNVNLTNTYISIGNSSVNTFITSSSIDTDGSLTVLNVVSFSNTLSVSGNTNFYSSVNVAGSFRAGNTTVNGSLIVNSFFTAVAANLANLNVTTSANIANLTVTSSANIQNQVSIQNDYIISVISNNNIGANTTSAQTVFSFPKNLYSSAKISAQIKTADNANTQIQEIVLAHDGLTNSFLTVYGTVSAPISANLGLFSTSINNANVELFFKQNTASSKVKIIAHLIV